MKQLFVEQTEAEIVERLKKMSQNIKKLQAVIDKYPDGKEKISLQKSLNERIKELSKNEQETAPKKQAQQPSAVATPPQENKQQAPVQNQQQQKATIPPPQEEAPKPSAVATSPQAATDDEAKLMKSLHGSFDPKSKMDLGKLEQMRAARKEVGDKADLKTLSKAVYAKQYAKQPPAPTQAPPQQATQQQAATQQAPSQQQPNLNVPKIQSPSMNAVQQMSASQAPFKMQSAGENTGQGPTQQAATAQAQTKTQAPVQQQTTKQETPFIRDMKKIGGALKKGVQNIYGGANQQKQEEAEENEDDSKKFQYFGLNKATVQEKNNISKFLRHLSEKNYSSAHKYLKAIVESKVKRNILQRIGKI